MLTIVSFAFQGTIAENVLRHLNLPTKKIISNSSQAIQEYIDQLIITQPQYILGLGQYTGRDQDKLRIETICTNKFRSTVLGNSLITKPLSSFLKPSQHTKYAHALGNSFCNLISYYLVTAINQNTVHAQYSFLHIPKSFPITQAVSEITAMLPTILIKNNNYR